MAAAPGKLRLVLDYVPCDACLAIPAASPGEQEMLCGICRRLDRTVAHKVTARTTVLVAEPEPPAEVVVPPVVAAPVEAAPTFVEPDPPALPTVEVVLRSGELPEPSADVQVVVAPLVPDAPEPAAAVPAVAAAEPIEEDLSDPFEFVAETREELFDFTPPPPQPAPEEKAAAAAQSFVLEPWPEEEEVAPERPVPAAAAVDEDVWAEPVVEEAPPEPAPWPAEPAREESPEPVPWPEEAEEVPVDAEPEEVPVEAEPEEVPVEVEPEEVPVEPEPEEVPVEAEDVEAVEAVEDAPGPNEAALPVTALDGVGARYERRLTEEGIRTLGDLAARNAGELAELTGIPERFLAQWIDEAKRRTK